MRALIVFGKDLRRYAFWVVLWGAACVLPLLTAFAQAGSWPSVPDADGFAPAALTTVFMLAAAVPTIRAVLFVALIVLPVHDDPLVDSTAFWLSRPIGGRALLAAKGLFIELVLVTPMVILEATQMRLVGIPWRAIVLAVPEMVLEWSAWAACIWALAALTSSVRGLLRALLAAASIATAVWLVLRLGIAAVVDGPSLGGLFTHVVDRVRAAFEMEPTLAASRSLVLLVISTATAMAIVAEQYLARRARTGWMILSLGLVAFTWAQSEWQWDLFAWSPSQSTRARNVQVVPQSLALNLAIPLLPPTTDASEDRPDGYRGVLNLAPAQAESDVAVEVSLLDGSFTLANGRRLDVSSDDADFGSWDPTVLVPLLGDAKVANLDPPRGPGVPLKVTTGGTKLTAGTVGNLDATVRIRLRRYRVATVLALTEGAEYSHDATQVVVGPVSQTGGECYVTLFERDVSLLFAPSATETRRMFVFRNRANVIHLLRNRARAEIFWPYASDSLGLSWPWHERVESMAFLMRFQQNLAAIPPPPRIDQDWMAGAELVRVEGEVLATTTRQITVPNLAIEPFPLRIRRAAATSPTTS